MENKKINVEVIDPKMPAAANGLLVVSSGNMNSSQVADGRLVINNGTVSTVPV